jgi:hypothetical protein
MSQPTQLTQTSDFSQEGSGIGGLVELFTPETAGDEIAEQNFIRRLKKKRKQQRRL